ncbi:hypothetical protein BC830DRAFT_1150417 [Chytriomyces sp. MP71]|nr:hypothetical protein BC830DRAFT_1150417 [Chytriomyces sp. MP71]
MDGLPGRPVDLEVTNLESLGTTIYTWMTWIVICVSIVQVVALGGQTIWLEGNGQPIQKLLKLLLLKPINLLLLLMIVSNLLINAFYYLSLSSHEAVASYLSTISTSSLLILMMIYSWERGKPVILAVSPHIAWPCKAVVLTFTSSQIAANASNLSSNLFRGNNLEASITTWQVYQGLLIVTAVLLLGFEFFTLAVYALYLSRARRADLSADVRRLQVISAYGVASALWNLVWQVIVNVNNHVPLDGNSLARLRLALWLTSFELGMPAVYLGLQLAMKLHLWKETAREVERKKGLVDRARQVVKNASGPGSQRDDSKGPILCNA